MLFFDGGAVGRIGHQHGFAQVFGGFARVLQQLFFQRLQLGLEKCHLCRIHVILLIHLQNFFFGQDALWAGGGGRFISFSHNFAYLRYDRVFKLISCGTGPLRCTGIRFGTFQLAG